MRTEYEIRKQLEWALKALDDEDNASEIEQIKLWQWIDALNWVLKTKEK